MNRNYPAYINLSVRSHNAIWTVFEKAGREDFLRFDASWEPKTVLKALKELQAVSKVPYLMRLFEHVKHCGPLTRKEIETWLLLHAVANDVCEDCGNPFDPQVAIRAALRKQLEELRAAFGSWGGPESLAAKLLREAEARIP